MCILKSVFVTLSYTAIFGFCIYVYICLCIRNWYECVWRTYEDIQFLRNRQDRGCVTFEQVTLICNRILVYYCKFNLINPYRDEGL
jgi:hypothetical protein